MVQKISFVIDIQNIIEKQNRIELYSPPLQILYCLENKYYVNNY